jgi:ABC-type glycerol-3-phosphate transport system substrate-binding protein
MENKYQKSVEITKEWLDVYDVLSIFNVTCPARQHAIKKLLFAGVRGGKDAKQDLQEVIQAVTRAIDLLLEE